MRIDITRIEKTREVTLGVLSIDGEVFCLTLENPWLNNSHNVSCIPDGIYLCEKYHSNKFGDTYQVKDVKDRSYILFHVGNLVDDTQGCILLGDSYGLLNSKRAVMNSKRTFESFIERLDGVKGFALNIRTV